MGGGLLPLTQDPRDFKFSAVFGAVKKLPEHSFRIGNPLEIKQQYSTDMCTAFALSAMSEYQEKIKLSPEYSFSRIKKIRGEWRQWGANLRDACKAAVKTGFLPQGKLPDKFKRERFNSDQEWRNYVANWENWTERVDFFAKPHRKKAYFYVDGSFDTFDNIRSALWMNLAEKRAVLTGVIWRAEWTYAEKGVIPLIYSDGGFGHAFIFIGQEVNTRIDTGQKKIYLVAQLSNGTDIGDGGIFYFPREVVNQECVFGNYTFRDLDPSLAQYLSENKKKYTLANRFWAYFRWWLKEIFLTEKEGIL